MKFLISLILLIAAIGGFFWYIEPAWANVGLLEGTINQYKQALSQTTQAIATKNTLVAEYNSFSQTQLSQLSEFLPQKIDPVSFILEINTIAAEYGSGLKSVTITTPSDSSDSTSGTTPSQQYSTLSASITTAMTYPNFVLFLKDLEQSLPPTDVTALSFTPPTTGSIYTFTLTLQTYYLPNAS